MTRIIEKKLLSIFDDIQCETREKFRLEITVEKEIVPALLSFLKNEGYNHLGLISCVDWLDENAFELLYILSAYMKNDNVPSDNEKINIILKTRIPRAKPVLLSAIPLFAIAEPYEREIHELFGIHFEGHPRLTPLFLEREYSIPPFRKDFDTKKYVKTVFDRVPFVEKKAAKK